MIKIDEEVYWNDQEDKQTEDTLNWFNANIYSKLGVDNDPEFIIPEFDKYGRPYRWVYNNEYCTIEVIREYIEPRKWAKKGDIIKVSKNE